MKQIPLLQGKALLIELPEGATDEKICEGMLYYRDNLGRDGIALPPGNWRIIGMLMDVSVEFEDKLEKFVDECDPMHADDPFWWDYHNDCYFDESMGARDTIESAIRAEGYTFQSTPKPENKDFYWGYLDDLAKWEAAQSRVLCRERCLLLGREG